MKTNQTDSQRPGHHLSSDAARITGERPGRLVLLCCTLVMVWPSDALGQRFKVVNVIPHERSGEEAQNSAPSLAVNPTKPSEAMLSAFGITVDGTGLDPFFLTRVGGGSWMLFDTDYHRGATLGWSTSGTLYAAVAAAVPWEKHLNVRVSADPAGGVLFTNLAHYFGTNGMPDPPWLSVVNELGVDRLYVGFNDTSRASSNSGDGRTASVWMSLDGGKTWIQEVIERWPGFYGAELDRDAPAIRVAAQGSRVYAVFARILKGGLLSSTNRIGEVVVARDDNGGGPDANGKRFQALGGVGPHGAEGVSISGGPVEFPDWISGGITLGQQRLGRGELSLAVDPTDSNRVFVAFVDCQAGGGTVLPQLHVVYSVDGGENWSTPRDLPLNTALPALAVAGDGRIGLLYTHLTESVAGILETHFSEFTLAQLANNFAARSDAILATFPDGLPMRVGEPYLGDYQYLVAVSNVFYGAFSASNDPKPERFPQGVFYQRNVLVDGEVRSNSFVTAPGVNVDLAGTSMPNLSIDPFFFCAGCQRDFGDAPYPYPTEEDYGGAWHFIVPGFHLGARVDGETNGMPCELANCDDNVGEADEDGVIFKTALRSGQFATIHVIASAAGKLDAWIDFNGNKSWQDASDQIFTNLTLAAGTNVLPFFVPEGAMSGNTYGRFRFSGTGNLPSFSPAIDGEVEDYLVPINGRDFGDLPDTMPGFPPPNGYDFHTLLANDGARHWIVPGFHLGERIDGEPDGQPGGFADDDDQFNGLDIGDEDGVVFLGVPQPGPDNFVIVTASAAGFLDAWCDFDSSHTLDLPEEQIFTSVPLVAGPNLLSFAVPEGKTTPWFRFRFSSMGGLGPGGEAPDGEVEDYGRLLPEEDFGDAPDPYPALRAADGARHRLRSGFHLGGALDADPDGQPHPLAMGDDLANLDDEDGVALPITVMAGQEVTIGVTASLPGRLDAWVDFDRDGAWAGPGERIFTNQALAAGVNALAFRVPPTALYGNTFARFRFTSTGCVRSDGLANDGEVEDYPLEIASRDFGDAPAPYPTLLAADGARHRVVKGLRLGVRIDAEPDGLPHPAAFGDDLKDLGDEDGILPVGPLVAGQACGVFAFASAAGKLDAWIDFNGDGDWTDPGEQVFAGTPLVAGVNALALPVPLAATLGPAVARFRFSSAGGLAPTGEAADGEVEDYMWVIEALDFGDAPPPYPTLLADGGAHHDIVPGFRLGALIDAEADGQPIPPWLGDDSNGLADEDGVTFLTPLYRGQVAKIIVTASAPGKLDAWIDFNADGDWADAGEGIFAAKPLLAGPNVLAFPVPATAAHFGACARFRFSSKGGLSYTGLAQDGEVEDYCGLEFVDPPPIDFGDAPAPHPTLLTNNGARHTIVAGFHLGATVDLELDGQPDPAALGDDLTGSDDEDGVVFLTPLTPGQTVQVQVTASANGKLDAWVDFNADGDWADAGEKIFDNTALSAGANTLAFSVPPTASVTNTFARFRFSTVGGLSFDGAANNGEVEDYAASIVTNVPNAEVTIAKSGSTNQLVVGNTVTYTIQVSNQGPATAQSLTATDTLPAEMLFVTAVPSQGSSSFLARSNAITAGSFASRFDLPAGTAGPSDAVIGDLNADGQADIVAANLLNTLSVFGNMGTNGLLSTNAFTPRVDLACPGVRDPNIVLADIDGDGRPDLVACRYFSNAVSVFRNTSTGGVLTSNSFAPRVDFPVPSASMVLAGDVDGDGKPDLVVSGAAISVLRNTSTSGVINSNAFVPRVDFNVGTGFPRIVLSDLDGDGRLDLVVGTTSDSTFSVLRNTSTSGVVDANSFAPKVGFTYGSDSTADVGARDLDGDGKPDVVLVNYWAGNVSVFRNISTGGSFTTNSLSPPVDFNNQAPGTSGNKARDLALGDVNADGRPDIVVVNTGNRSTVAVLQNLCLPGSITSSSFAPSVEFLTRSTPWRVALGDLNGDGNAELLTLNNDPFGGYKMSVHRNSNTGGTVSWNLGSLAAGTTATLLITVQPRTTGSMTNVASLARPNQGALSASAKTLVLAPTIASITWNTNIVRISFVAQLGQTYFVEYENSLDAPNWSLLSIVEGTGTTVTVSDSLGTSPPPMRVYRLRLP